MRSCRPGVSGRDKSRQTLSFNNRTLIPTNHRDNLQGLDRPVDAARGPPPATSGPETAGPSQEPVCQSTASRQIPRKPVPARDNNLESCGPRVTLPIVTQVGTSGGAGHRADTLGNSGAGGFGSTLASIQASPPEPVYGSRRQRMAERLEDCSLFGMIWKLKRITTSEV